MDKEQAKSPGDNTLAPALSRRKIFAGAGTAGALAALAAALPAAQSAAPALASATPGATEDGYRLTEHIKQYYQTARA